MSNGNVYQIITERVVALLEKGVVPWQKPWTVGQSEPRNLVSKKAYRGVNAFLLHAMPFTSPYWVSFKQAQASGGTVRKGEKATPVIFWKWLETKERDPETGKFGKVPLLRYYSAFNVDQCDGVTAPVSEQVTREHTPIESAEAIVNAMPKRPEIKLGGGQASYSPSLDIVRMPNPETFVHGEEYYSVLFHELTHATGHQDRLNRKDFAKEDALSFGSHSYAKEELVAEMGAAFLSSHAGIVERTLDNSAAYVANWLKRLKDDSKLVVMAAAQAQKAADFILDVQHAGDESEAQS